MESKQSEKIEYRILYKICCTQSDAIRELNKIKDKVKHPFIELSQTSGGWIIYLFSTDNKNLAEEGRRYYKKNGLECFIQIKTIDTIR